MKDWKAIVNRYHEAFPEANGSGLVIGPPSTLVEIETIEGRLGRRIPEEMRDFYQTMNGFGTNSAHYGLLWFFVPLAELPRLIEEFGETVADHQSDLPDRFLPFIDWFCGDVTGYLWDDDGSLVPGLCMFEHESFHYEPDQDESEFMIKSDRSIEEFLTP